MKTLTEKINHFFISILFALFPSERFVHILTVNGEDELEAHALCNKVMAICSQTGAPQNRVMDCIIQIQAKGVLRHEDYWKLVYLSFPIGIMITDRRGGPDRSLMRDVKEGKVSWEEVEKSIIELKIK